MVARRFLDIKNAQRSDQERRNNPLEKNGRITEGCKRGSTPVEVVTECRDGRVVRK